MSAIREVRGYLRDRDLFGMTGTATIRRGSAFFRPDDGEYAEIEVLSPNYVHFCPVTIGQPGHEDFFIRWLNATGFEGLANARNFGVLWQ